MNNEFKLAIINFVKEGKTMVVFTKYDKDALQKIVDKEVKRGRGFGEILYFLQENAYIIDTEAPIYNIDTQIEDEERFTIDAVVGDDIGMVDIQAEEYKKDGNRHIIKGCGLANFKTAIDLLSKARDFYISGNIAVKNGYYHIDVVDNIRGNKILQGTITIENDVAKNEIMDFLEKNNAFLSFAKNENEIEFAFIQSYFDAFELLNAFAREGVKEIVLFEFNVGTKQNRYIFDKNFA